MAWLFSTIVKKRKGVDCLVNFAPEEMVGYIGLTVLEYRYYAKKKK